MKINKDRIYINKGTHTNIELYLQNMSFENMAIKKQEKNSIDIEINAIFYFEAPVKEKTIVGNMKVKVGGKEIEVLDIYNKEDIKKKEVKDYMKEFLYSIRYL